MRRPRRPRYFFPPDIMPDRFAVTHDIWNRTYWHPQTMLTPPHAWAPMTDAEWDLLWPILMHFECGLTEQPAAGRPMADVRQRLDAIFRAVTLKHPKGGRAAWAQLPPEFGKPDTVSRTYRRWLKAGLWGRLLLEAVDLDATPVQAALRWRLCCAFRRGWRLMGLRAIVLARNLKLYSALPAPSQWLPDPYLSEKVLPIAERAMRYWLDHPNWVRPPSLFPWIKSAMRLAGGRVRITRAMEPL